MALNNLRIISKNLVDLATTTVVASTTASGTSTANLKLDPKSSVWRSTANTSTTITVTFAADQVVGAVVLPFCNLTKLATIQFTCKDSVGTVVANGTSTTTTAAPWPQVTPWNGETLPVGVSTYAYGGGTYARCYLPNKAQVTCRSVVITLVDTTNTSAYLEAARLVVGSYWSPQYNTSYGLSTSTVDLSQNERSEAGNLVTNRAPQYDKLMFDLAYLTPTDRQQLDQILRGNGLSKPLFISLFPENVDDYAMEGMHQLYGKLSQLSAVTYSNYSIYNTQIELEEV